LLHCQIGILRFVILLACHFVIFDFGSIAYLPSVRMSECQYGAMSGVIHKNAQY
jgi:hypothetical protein